jgi:hypothetical protein
MAPHMNKRNKRRRKGKKMNKWRSMLTPEGSSSSSLC